MKQITSRRSAMAKVGAGVAGIAALPFLVPNAARAAMSSAAGVVAGGSLEGQNGPVQFSAFASRLRFDDGTDPVVLGSFDWYDPAGMDGSALTFALVTLENYGPGEPEGTRVIAGTVSVNGEGEHPFGLWLENRGEIGAVADSLRLVVGSAAIEQLGTPVPADAVSDFAYEVQGDLATGNIQLISLG